MSNIPERKLRKTATHVWILFIFRGESTREPASNVSMSRMTYFILGAQTGTGVSHSQHRKNSGEVLEKMQMNGPEG